MISSPAGRRAMGRVPFGLGRGKCTAMPVGRFGRGGPLAAGGRVGPGKGPTAQDANGGHVYGSEMGPQR